ncbi:MAG: phosphoribosylanthranilate isomerase [Chitinophagaceae bacterium]|nr:MAG: phosphoribosylanthranilate isomerase [Chitinophagaceae bacterium]
MRTRVKICCISSTEEAKTAIGHGADALGLVGKMPSGPGPIPDWLIAEIVKAIHPPIASFLLTSEQSSEEIIYHVKRVDTNTVQIVDELTTGTYNDIRTALPHLKIVQVIHVTGEESIEQAVRVSPEVDALLLDSGNPKAALKTLGGTGNVHNWEISRDIVKSVNVPVFLAGGLNSMNVYQAIKTVQPFGVDICSGVRTEGKLDPSKLREFFKAVHGF